ncbi:MAG: hypothetical protein LBM02_04060 [Lachnospiraceae bacterium]|jgi:hypothetical protein|nr:hypothetical protein [Lachnospiraceae bacterium]
MEIELGKTFDSFEKKIEKTGDSIHKSVEKFHKNYVSKVIPDMGRYGDAGKFAAEMLPGVAEYNAIKDGDWKAFAMNAGIDVGAIAVGAVTAGAGYGAIKGGSVATKLGVKKAVKEVAEAGTKKVVREGTETVVKKVAQETGEKVVKEGSEKVIKGTLEKNVREITKKGTKEIIEKLGKEVGEKVVKFSDEIIEAAKIPPTQLKILESQKLEEGLVNGRKALKQIDLELDKMTPRIKEGREVVESNLERMKEGLAPIGKDGNPIELHHVGQKMDSPLAELEQSVHHRNFKELHEIGKTSEIDRKAFRQQKIDYWKARARQLEEGLNK